MAAPPERPPLAPLQRVMLRDSLAEPRAGHHVEQVEIQFAPGVSAAQVVSAWEKTVARTEALRVAFTLNDFSLEAAAPGELSITAEDWENWLETDRKRPLLEARRVPWRAVYWPEERRFVWTFHHALLDGRSITRVLQNFLERVSGRAGETLALSKWSPPSREEVEMARESFGEIPPPPELGKSIEPGGAAVRCLGPGSCKADAALLIWAWGRALAAAAGGEAVWVEQVRAGAPQPGSAGFSMLTLPLRLGGGESADELRGRLLAMRAIERVSVEDFPPGEFPEGGSVIMIERATPAHQMACDAVESLALHEAQGETLLATAYLLPDLRLEVEGPGRHEILERWLRALEAGR